MTTGNPPVVLLSGGDRLGIAIEEKLVQAGACVERVALLGEPTQIAAQSESASVLVLAADDDAGNVDIALAVRSLRPDLPLVVRLFDPALVSYLKDTLDKIAVLSMSAVAAPVFAEAALGVMSKPRDQSGVVAGSKGNVPRARSSFRPDRVLVTSFLGFVALVGASALFFAFALDLSTIDALYFVCSTITTVGYGDIALKGASTGVKMAGMALMFSGAAFMAVLFALFTGWVVARRLNVLRGRVRVRGRGHALIVGGGNIGFRVAGLLDERKHRVVVVEKDAESRHIGALRTAGHRVIVADATSDGILDLAGLEGASSVIAVTDSDATNLHIALLVRAFGSGIPVVMRAESPELSAHVCEKRDAVAISPIAVAVDEFARAALALSDHR